MKLFDQFSTERSVTIYVGSPQEFIAYGLGEGDKITVQIALLGSMEPNFLVNGCSLVDNSKQVLPVQAVSPYVVCGCPVQAKEKSPRFIISRPGAYIITFLGDSFGDAVVEARSATPEAIKEFEDSCTSYCECEDETWTPTGEIRCIDGNVEQLEKSNCDNLRWEVVGPQTWTPTGDERCVGDDIVLIEEVNECGQNRWETTRPQEWIPTGETRCENYVVEIQEVNDCGRKRWVPTEEPCGYCPSLLLPLSSCVNQAGYGFRPGDAIDPRATSDLKDCEGNILAFIYPDAAPGHSIEVINCDGEVIGYAANESDCSGKEAQFVEILSPLEMNVRSMPDLKVAKLPDLKVSELPRLTIAEMPTLEIKRSLVEAIQVGDEVWKYWNDGTKEVEKLGAPPPVYCASYLLPMELCETQAGYAFRPGDSRDPEAVIELSACDEDFKVFIYPYDAPGHSIAVRDCDGVLLGFAANDSGCSGKEVSTIEVANTVGIKVESLPAVKLERILVSAIRVDDAIWTYWSDGRKEIERLPKKEPAFCGSYPLPFDLCDGHIGYAYRENDYRDPNATVRIDSCDNGFAVYIYPSPAPGHTIEVKDCDGRLLGYGLNNSDCAGKEITTVDIPSPVNIRIDHAPVLRIERHTVSALIHNNELLMIWSDGTRTIEKLLSGSQSTNG